MTDTSQAGHDALPPPGGPCSQRARRGVVAVTGCTGIGHDNLPGAAGAQIHQAVANLRAALPTAGAGTSDVIAIRVHRADLGDFAGLNRCQEVFARPYPARTTVSAMLPPGALAEANALALTQPERPMGMPAMDKVIGEYITLSDGGIPLEVHRSLVTLLRAIVTIGLSNSESPGH